jgi:hypothetical protein
MCKFINFQLIQQNWVILSSHRNFKTRIAIAYTAVQLKAIEEEKEENWRNFYGYTILFYLHNSKRIITFA